MDVRSGESDKNWFRSERFMHVNNKWYYVTREFTQEGPFESKADAERELHLYIRYETDELLRHANEKNH